MVTNTSIAEVSASDLYVRIHKSNTAPPPKQAQRTINHGPIQPQDARDIAGIITLTNGNEQRLLEESFFSNNSEAMPRIVQLIKETRKNGGPITFGDDGRIHIPEDYFQAIVKMAGSTDPVFQDKPKIHFQ